MISENAVHWIKQHLRTGKYPTTSWLSQKLNFSTSEAQAVLTEYKAGVESGAYPGPSTAPPPPLDTPIRSSDPASRVTGYIQAHGGPASAQRVAQAPLKRLAEESHQSSEEPVLTTPPPTPSSDMEGVVKVKRGGGVRHGHSPKILILIGAFALYIGMFIDLTVGEVFFLGISPGPLEAVGMGTLALIVVLFKPKAYAEGHLILWFLCASLTWWAGVSFAMVSTQMQTTAVAVAGEADRELEDLKGAVTDAQAKLNDAQDALKNVPTGYKSEVIARESATRLALEVLDSAKSDLKDYKSIKNTDKIENKSSGINPDNAFMAIPEALINGSMSRKIGLFFFSILFGVLEYIIAVSSKPKNKEDEIDLVQRSLAT